MSGDKYLSEWSLGQPKDPQATYRTLSFRCSDCGRDFDEAKKDPLPPGQGEGYLLLCECGRTLSTTVKVGGWKTP